MRISEAEERREGNMRGNEKFLHNWDLIYMNQREEEVLSLVVVVPLREEVLSELAKV